MTKTTITVSTHFSNRADWLRKLTKEDTKQSSVSKESALLIAMEERISKLEKKHVSFVESEYPI